MSWNCPNCGSECSSRFCSNCGTPQPGLDGDPNASQDIVEGILPKGPEETTSFEEEQRQETLVPDEDAAESIAAPSGEDEPSSGSDSAETDEDALILTDEEPFIEAEPKKATRSLQTMAPRSLSNCPRKTLRTAMHQQLGRSQGTSASPHLINRR